MGMSERPFNQRAAYAYALATVVPWSTVATAFKLTLRYLDPLQLLLYASLVSTLTLATLLAARGRLRLVLSCLARCGSR
ncbi:hypothetical protein ACFL59_03650 [Planctomycetota bacterium]